MNYIDCDYYKGVRDSVGYCELMECLCLAELGEECEEIEESNE